MLEHDQPARRTTTRSAARITGPVGGLPIQTPVSPDGKYMVTANTLTATIIITDTKTDSWSRCCRATPACHGMKFGAKKGGGYYAYVANKFANVLTIVDADPNSDGNFGDATIAGRVLLTASASTASDDTVVAVPGHGRPGRAGDPGPLQRVGAAAAAVVEEPADAEAAQSDRVDPVNTRGGAMRRPLAPWRHPDCTTGSAPCEMDMTS